MPPEHFMDAKLKCVFEMPEGHREEAAAAALKAIKTEATLPQKVKNEEKVNVEFVKRKGSISIVFNYCVFRSLIWIIQIKLNGKRMNSDSCEKKTVI